MPKFTVRESKGGSTELTPLAAKLTELLTNVYECADDGGTEGAQISRIAIRRNDNGGWLLVAGWKLDAESSVPHQDGIRDSDAYVSFHGGSELIAALATLEESLAAGEVVLIPDRFNGNRPSRKARK